MNLVDSWIPGGILLLIADEIMNCLNISLFQRLIDSNLGKHAKIVSIDNNSLISSLNHVRNSLKSSKNHEILENHENHEKYENSNVLSSDLLNKAKNSSILEEYLMFSHISDTSQARNDNNSNIHQSYVNFDFNDFFFEEFLELTNNSHENTRQCLENCDYSIEMIDNMEFDHFQLKSQKKRDFQSKFMKFYQENKKTIEIRGSDCINPQRTSLTRDLQVIYAIIVDFNLFSLNS